MSKPNRKYSEPWLLLKQNGTIKVQISHSENDVVIKRYSKTYIRGVQKEKYSDESFRVRFPNAELSSEIDFTTGTVTIKLDKQDYSLLETL